MSFNKQKHQTHDLQEDRVTEGVTMYPVFCTANIPSKV